MISHRCKLMSKLLNTSFGTQIGQSQLDSLIASCLTNIGLSLSSLVSPTADDNHMIVLVGKVNCGVFTNARSPTNNNS